MPQPWGKLTPEENCRRWRSGLLTDGQGDDTFTGTTKCQCASENGALASLYKDQGNDKYVADGSAQSYAFNEGVAYMFDLQGNDCIPLAMEPGLALPGRMP